ncbi:MAG: polynucleotide adenylyltransferase PcnB [Rubrivivax sp.]|nr:polynucleotide adenylyltransferase PcnB [Rubrivivax sp.]
MIRKFIDKLLGKAPAEAQALVPAGPPLGQRVEIPVATHGIDPKLLDDNAVRVVRTLQEGGYEAYIVGGAVRDLLVGLKPKDFDVATNATPEQVKALFRRAFIIGRRFRLVHVIYGRGREHEVIEVSTFRALLDASAADAVPGNEKTSKQALSGMTHAVDASGRVLRDNVWGPQVDDAARRDFTVNAMYYDPLTQTVVDYHGGLQDARAKVLRMIGDADTRYREDPVRIIRVLRFAAKLGFAIEPGTKKPIAATAPLLANVPVSRLFDEMVKLLQTGHAIASLAQLRLHPLPRGVFPILDLVLEQAAQGGAGDRFVQLALADTDRRVGEGKPVAPSFLLACLLWHEVLGRWTTLRQAGEAPMPALQQAVDAVFEARIGDISGRGKLGADMREIWTMQPRFERRFGSGPYSLVEQPRYRAGYDFLKLRADTGEVDAELPEWWEDFALGSDDEREAMVQAAREAQQQAPRRVPRTVRVPAAATPAVAAEAGAEEAPAEEGEGADPTAPRKRRRRRRKPGGAAGPEGAAPATE